MFFRSHDNYYSNTSNINRLELKLPIQLTLFTILSYQFFFRKYLSWSQRRDKMAFNQHRIRITVTYESSFRYRCEGGWLQLEGGGRVCGPNERFDRPVVLFSDRSVPILHMQ